MIQVTNITTGYRFGISTKSNAGSIGVPGLLDLEPGGSTFFPRRALHDFSAYVKEQLAELVANGIVRVYEVDSVHLYQDKDHALAYDNDDLVLAPAPDALATALLAAADFTVKYNQHVTDLVFHTAPTAAIGAANPTDLPSLLIWLAAVQPIYAAHIAAAAAHPTVDTWSTLLPAIVPVGLPTAVTAMQQLIRMYGHHKTCIDLASAALLDIPAIMTY